MEKYPKYLRTARDRQNSLFINKMFVDSKNDNAIQKNVCELQ